MTPNLEKELAEKLQNLASILHSKLISKTGNDRVPALQGDYLLLHKPAFKSHLNLGNEHLGNLPRLLYGSEYLDAYKIRRAWDSATTFIVDGQDLLAIIQPYFSEFPFNANTPAGCLVQLMCAIWYMGGRFVVSNKEASYQGHGFNFQVDQRKMTHLGQWHRLPKKEDTRLTRFVDIARPPKKKANLELTGVYKYFQLVFPELGNELFLIFSTALHANLGEHLTSVFDIEYVGSVEDYNSTSLVKDYMNKFQQTSKLVSFQNSMGSKL